MTEWERGRKLSAAEVREMRIGPAAMEAKEVLRYVARHLDAKANGQTRGLLLDSFVADRCRHYADKLVAAIGASE